MVDLLEVETYPCLYISLDAFGDEIAKEMMTKKYQRIEYLKIDDLKYICYKRRYDYIVIVGNNICTKTIDELDIILNSNNSLFKAIFSLAREDNNYANYPKTHFISHNSERELVRLVMNFVGLTCNCGLIGLDSFDMYDCISYNRQVDCVYVEGNNLQDCVAKALAEIPRDKKGGVLSVFTIPGLNIPKELVDFKEKMARFSTIDTFVVGTQDKHNDNLCAISIYMSFGTKG